MRNVNDPVHERVRQLSAEEQRLWHEFPAKRPEALWSQSQLRRRVRVGARDMVREGSFELIRSHYKFGVSNG